LAVKVTFLKGVKGARAAQLARLGVETVEDLVRLSPRYYEDRTRITDVDALRPGLSAVIRVRVLRVNFRRIDRKRTVLNLKTGDRTGDITVTFYNQPYNRDKFTKGDTVLFFGKVSSGYYGLELVNPEALLLSDEEALLAAEAEPDGDNYPSDANAGANALLSVKEGFQGIFPVYPLTAGLSQKVLRKFIKEALALLPPIKDPLPPDIRETLGLPELDRAVRGIHFPATLEDGENCRRRLAFDELLETRLKLLMLKNSYAFREGGIRYGHSELTDRFTAALPFELTASQEQVWREIAADMASSRPMNRLVLGDVGSGKTVIAELAMLTAAGGGRQSAFMAPTEVLAEQHYRNIAPAFEALGVKVRLLTGAVTGAARRQVLSEIASGEAQCVIGTHALIQPAVEWHSLGLAVTDEQHRFGVRQRGVLAGTGGTDGTAPREVPDILVMTATPIPRTLALILYGDLDISRLDMLPSGRLPIQTFVDDGRRKERIYKWAADKARNGEQIYIVHAAIGLDNDSDADIDADADGLEEPEAAGDPTLLSALANYEKCKDSVFAGLSCALLHGKMADKDKNAVMRAFAAGDISVLFSTTVIEVGVDVPNATVMIVENAERFGLAQLHQLRGRVGRGKLQSSCVLISGHPLRVSDPGDDLITRRLLTLKNSTDGTKIAEEDLKLRGPGDFFGVSQHGIPEFHTANLYTDLDLLSRASDIAARILPDRANYASYLDYIAASLPENLAL